MVSTTGAESKNNHCNCLSQTHEGSLEPGEDTGMGTGRVLSEAYRVRAAFSLHLVQAGEAREAGGWEGWGGWEAGETGKLGRLEGWEG